MRRPEVDAAISRRPKDTDGLMPYSLVKVRSAIPTGCGESCADMEDFAIGFCFFRKSDLYQSWNCFHGRSEEDNTEHRRRHYCSVCRDHDGPPVRS